MRLNGLIFVILFSLLFFSGCSGLSKKDCESINWLKKGGVDARSKQGWRKKAQAYNKSCTKYGVKINTEDYLLGVRKAGAQICTEYSDFGAYGWSGVGYRDALMGIPLDVKIYKSTCGVYDLVLEETQITKGYKEGLNRFCKLKNGYKYGLRGKAYQPICPARKRAAFLRGYNAGVLQHNFEIAADSFTDAQQRVAVIKKKIENEKTTGFLAAFAKIGRDLSIAVQSSNRELSRLRTSMSGVDPADVQHWQDQISAVNFKLRTARRGADVKRATIKNEMYNSQREVLELNNELRELQESLPRLKIKFLRLKVKTDEAYNQISNELE